jgi:hypothetical protein
MTKLRSVLLALSVAASVAAVSAMVTGCGTGITPQANSSVKANAFQIQGTVFGGSQPITGATIQLYAASTNGYGQPYTAYPAGSSSLLTSAVTTTGTGDFSIGGGIFACPASNPDVYIVASGGNPGLSSGDNANIALMAALGPCQGITQNTHIRINELTTVASVWALSPFMSGIAAVGTSAGNVTGLTNAFATVDKLVDIGVGNLPGPALPSGATLPVQKVNLIADILASCVNSPGVSTTNTAAPCNELFSAATPANGTAPTDTITAAMNLAQNPNTSITTVVMNVSALSPFQPALASAPADLGLIITYSGGALSTPKGIAADTAGNLWVPNAGNNTVSKLDALGVTTTDDTGFLSGATGFTAGSLSTPSAVALDQSGTVWISNSGNSTVSRLSSDGSSATVYMGGGLNSPSGLAIDAAGNAWVSNFGNASVTEITNSGTFANFAGVAITSPNAVAINPK